MGGVEAMKRWQDSYYTAHPVVRESCTAFPGVLTCTIPLDEDSIRQLSKQFNMVVPAPVPPTKPAKGSKRYPTEYERGYEAAFRDLQSHSALTIPMPQVERDKPCPKMPEGVQYAIVCGPQPIPEKEPHLTPDQWLQEHPLITCTASIPPICDDAPAVKP